MADLEDRLLKKNIPGKYSWWDDGYNKEKDRLDQHEDSESDNENVGDDLVDGRRAKINNSKSSEGSRSSSGKSGVKGVLTDYRLHQEEKKRAAWIDRMEREELMERHTLGAKLQPGEVSISMAATQDRLRQEKQTRHRDEEDVVEEEEADDDEFLTRYHRRRLQELQIRDSLPEFEGVEEVDPVGYSMAVDNTDPRVLIVVHLYETYVPACRSLIPIMENLSRNSMRGSRFLSLRASSASATLDPLALPSVLLYRERKLVGNLTPITRHLPPDFTPKHVEDLLHDAIGIRCVRQSAVELNVRERPRDDYDSDAELDEFCKDFSDHL